MTYEERVIKSIPVLRHYVDCLTRRTDLLGLLSFYTGEGVENAYRMAIIVAESAARREVAITFMRTVKQVLLKMHGLGGRLLWKRYVKGSLVGDIMKEYGLTTSAYYSKMKQAHLEFAERMTACGADENTFEELMSECAELNLLEVTYRGVCGKAH